MGAEVNRAAITKFLMKAWQYPPNGDELCRVLVEHMGSTKHQEIWSCDVDPKTFSPDGSTFEISEAMIEDAEGLGGIQKYVIKAYHGKRKTPQVKRVSVDARADNVDDDFSEPANAKGLVSQLMRHNEAATRLALGGAHENQKMLLSTIRELREENAQLRQERKEYLAEREELHTKKHERELEVKLVESQEKRKDEVMGELKLLLPVVAQKLGFRALGPGGAAASDADAVAAMATIRKLVESITPEQMANIAGTLKPAQLAAFMTLADSVQKKG